MEFGILKYFICMYICTADWGFGVVDFIVTSPLLLLSQTEIIVQQQDQIRHYALLFDSYTKNILSSL